MNQGWWRQFLPPWHHLKLGASSQAYRRPRSNLIEPQQPQGSKYEPPQTIEFINLDEILSPNIEPASPTPVVEETQQTTVVGMDIDILHKKLWQGFQVPYLGGTKASHAQVKNLIYVLWSVVI